MRIPAKKAVAKRPAKKVGAAKPKGPVAPTGIVTIEKSVSVALKVQGSEVWLRASATVEVDEESAAQRGQELTTFLWDTLAVDSEAVKVGLG